MKKSFIGFLFLSFISISAHSQSISIPDSISGWEQSWVANLNGSQAAYDNWSQGGVNSISGTASSVLNLLYNDGLFGYGFRLNLKYGQARSQGQGTRKTDDVIAIRNRFSYDFNEDSPYSAFAKISLETQFAPGYEYDAAADGGDSLISNFFAPAYLQEGVGIAYKPNDNFMFEGGVALKQTIVLEDELIPVYGLEPGENLRNEAGITTSINFEKEIAENIVYLSSIETFTNVTTALDKTDVMWSNELVGQINSLINASLQFELRYDDDFSSEIQLKQVLSAGISVSLY